MFKLIFCCGILSIILFSIKFIIPIIVILFSFLSDLANENIYIFGIICTQIYYSISPMIIVAINLLCKSTFITHFHVHTDKENFFDENRGHLIDWTLHFITKKYEEGKLYSLATTIDVASSTKKIWYNKDANDTLPQIKYIPGYSYSLYWHQNRPIIINMDTGKDIYLYSFCVPWCRNQIWRELFDEVIKVYKDDVESKQKIYKIDQNSFNKIGLTQPNIVGKVTLDDGRYTLTQEMMIVVEHVKNFLSESNKKYCKDNKLVLL